MNKQYDYEWITKDLNDCILLKAVDKDNKCVKAYQAVDVVNCVGDDVRIGQANIYDISNLLTIGTIRFTSYNGNEVLDIPFRNIHILFKEPNIMSVNNLPVIKDKKISLDELDAFAVINDSFICDEYKIIATKISKESEALKKFIDIAKEYGQMGMNEKFNALAKIDTLNYHREKTK